MVQDVEAAADSYAAAIPDLLDDQRMRDRLGLDYGQWCRGREAGGLPGEPIRPCVPSVEAMGPAGMTPAGPITREDQLFCRSVKQS